MQNVDDFHPTTKLVVRIIDFKAAVAAVDILRLMIEDQIINHGIQLLEFVNPVLKRYSLSFQAPLLLII